MEWISELIQSIIQSEFFQMLPPEVRNSLIAGGSLGLSGTLVWKLWAYIVYPFKVIRRWFFRKLTYKAVVQAGTDKLYDILNDYLRDNHSSSFRNVEYRITPPLKDGPIIRRRYYAEERDEDLDENTPLYITQFQETYWIYLKKIIPIKVSKIREKLEGAQSQSNSHKDYFTLTSYFFSKKAIQNFLNKVKDNYLEKTKKNFKVGLYYPRYDDWSLETYVPYRDVDSIIHPNWNELEKDLKQYRLSKEWYDTRGILYKRGYCFYGPPGNGKSSMIRALAHYLRRDIYYLSLNDITNDTRLHSICAKIPDKALLVIEDIDSFMDKRKINKDSKRSSGTVSFSSILNFMDGLGSSDSTITIITTNKLSKLDTALIRPGRIDKMFEFANPDMDSVKQYLQKFYSEPRVNVELPEDCILSFSDLQKLCMENSVQKIGEAIKRYCGKKKRAVK